MSLAVIRERQARRRRLRKLEDRHVALQQEQREEEKALPSAQRTRKTRPVRKKRPPRKINRKSNGRFAKGGGPGRPKTTITQAAAKVSLAGIPDDEWAIATLAILKKAQNGDVSAYRALAPYKLGLPVQRTKMEMSGSPDVMDTLREAISRVKEHEARTARSGGED